MVAMVQGDGGSKVVVPRVKDKILEALFISSCFLGLIVSYIGFTDLVPWRISAILMTVSIVGFIVTGLVVRGGRKTTLRTFQEAECMTMFPAWTPASNGIVVKGYLGLDRSAILFNLDRAGDLLRARITMDRLESYSAQVNAADRRAEPIVRGVPRRDIVLHVTGPDVAMTVAYRAVFDDGVRYVLDAAGLQDLSPRQDGPGATK